MPTKGLDSVYRLRTVVLSSSKDMVSPLTPVSFEGGRRFVSCPRREAQMVELAGNQNEEL